MKLSEAMFEGIKETKPLRNEYIHNGYKHVYACALGAALFHVKPEVSDFGSDVLEAMNNDSIIDVFPEAANMVSYDIWGRSYPSTHTVAELVTILNDSRKLPRRSIVSIVKRLGY